MNHEGAKLPSPLLSHRRKQANCGVLPPRMTATDEDSDWHEQSEIDTATSDRSDTNFFESDVVNEPARNRSRSKTSTKGKKAEHTYETSQSPPPYRPNRWKGTDEKWRRLTRPERDLIDQLDELENRDWAKGLYRAYLIKERKRRRFEDDKELRSRNTEADWTAWPLRPEDITKADDRVEYKLKKHREPRKRHGNIAHIDLHGQQYNAAPESCSGSSSDDESDSDLPSIADLTETVLTYDPQVFKPEPDLRPSSSLEELVIAHMMRTGKERFRERMSRPDFESAGYSPSADDELMTMQLRPVARNIITKFEGLLHGMHQRAEKRRPRGRRRARVDSETSYGYTSAQGPSVKSSRRRSKVKSETSDSEYDHHTTPESTHEFHGTSKEKSEVANSSRNRSLETRDRHATTLPTRKTMANRTWESVMLVASLQDWPKEVLDRTNQRLQELFGKSATLAPRRRDAQVDHRDENLVCPVPECPHHMEPFSEASDLDRHMQLIHGGKKSPRPFSLPVSRSQSRSHSRARGTLSGAEEQEEPREWRKGMKGDYVNTNLICPVSDCRRHKQPFSRLWNLKEHMKVRHPTLDLPESIQPQNRKRSHSRPRTHSRPRSASSRRYKSDDTIISTDDDQESGREEVRDSKRFYCPIKGCKRSIDGFSRNWNLQKHLRSMHPAWVAGYIG